MKKSGPEKCQGDIVYLYVYEGNPFVDMSQKESLEEVRASCFTKETIFQLLKARKGAINIEKGNMADRVEKIKMNFRGDTMPSTVVVEEMSVDWRGKPCKSNNHGGMKAAVFVLGLSLSLSLLSASLSFLYIHLKQIIHVAQFSI